MLKRLLTFICAISIATVAAAAPQQTKPSAPAKSEDVKQPAKAPAEPPPMPLNIRIEVSITDQTGQGPAAKKLVTMIAADRQVTSIRSSASVPVRNINNTTVMNYRNVTINVDARPSILVKEPNKVSVNFGLEYQPKSRGETEEAEPGMAALNERLGLILESGKPMVISQAADPTSDRKITVEITATILR